MRSSTLVLTFSVLASVVPSLAARPGSPYARGGPYALLKREDTDFLARELA